MRITGFICLLLVTGVVSAQDDPIADPAQLAFERGDWEEAIAEFQEILAELPGDRLSWLRIAQAQRELGRYDDALASLEFALDNEAPEAMAVLERSRNLLGLGRVDEGLIELERADHLELRARMLLEQAEDFDVLREDPRFQRVYANVRARVFPCEGIPEASQFDFWLGRWEVRRADGTLLGHNTITREQGGCVIREEWEGTPGSSGSSMTFYLPSRGQWRQVWIGSGGTHIDVVGGPVDGEIRLEGTIEYVDPENVVAFRSTWTEGTGGRVRQLMEQFEIVTSSWLIWFDGIYRRVD